MSLPKVSFYLIYHSDRLLRFFFFNLIWRCPILDGPTLRKNADNLTSEGQVLVLLIVAFFSLPGVQPADNSIIIKITRLQSMLYSHVVPHFIFC